MTGFSDPILTGDGSLIREVAKSPNYAAGTAGWSINANGSAEFNNVTVRGPVQVIGSDGSYVYVQTSGGTAEIVLEPPTRLGYTWSPGTIATESDGLSGRADMVITSPEKQGSAGGVSQILLEGGDGATPTSLIQLGAHDVSVTGVLTAANIASGAVTITPVANTPTSATVSGLSVAGSTFVGQATASTAVIGSTVMGVAVSSVTASSLLVWVYRTNTTGTGVYWMVIGK